MEEGPDEDDADKEEGEGERAPVVYDGSDSDDDGFTIRRFMAFVAPAAAQDELRLEVARAVARAEEVMAAEVTAARAMC